MSSALQRSQLTQVASPGSHSWSAALLGHDPSPPRPSDSGSIPEISELTLRLSKRWVEVQN